MLTMLQWICIVFLLFCAWAAYEIKQKYFKDINSPDLTTEILGNPVLKFKDKEWKIEELEEQGYQVFNVKKDITFGDKTLEKNKVVIVDKTPEPEKGDFVLVIVGGDEEKGDRIMLYQVKTKHKDGKFTVIRDIDKRTITIEKIKGKVVGKQG